MNRKIKALGLALVAALALSAVMASAASAQFTSDKPHTILSGSQEGNHVFTAGEGFGGITCSTASFSGTGTGTEESEQTITPNYSGCKDSFGRTVHVHNNLTYKFTVTGTSGGTPVGEVHVSGSMQLTVTSGGSVVCTVTIKTPQANNGITYHDSGNGILVTTEATNVNSTTAGGFFNCGVSNGEHKNGTYDGDTKMTGIGTDGLEADIDVD